MATPQPTAWYLHVHGALVTRTHSTLRRTRGPGARCSSASFAIVLESNLQSIANLIAYCLRHHDPAGFGATLQADGDVYAVAINVLAFHDNVSEVNTDPKLKLALSRPVR